MLTHLRVLLGGMLAEVFYLVLRWDRLYRISYYLLFFGFFLGEIWRKYIDGWLCISSWYSKAEPP